MTTMAMGPVLYIGKCDAQSWNFFVNILLKDGATAGELDVEVTSSHENVRIGSPIVSADFSQVGLEGLVSWRWPVEVRRTAAEQRVSYQVAPKPGREIGRLKNPLVIDGVAIPAADSPPDVAFVSCNGVDDPKLFNRVEEIDALWGEMHEIHDSADGSSDDHPGGYHLLIGGGDQIYADEIWRCCSALKRFETPLAVKGKKPLTDGQVVTVLKYYIGLYAERWSRKKPAAILARVPGVFTWDDHDIFDGWGSYKKKLQEDSPVFQQVYEQAALAFEAFQLGSSEKLGGARPANLEGDGSHYLQTLDFASSQGRMSVVLLDSRSGRSMDVVLSTPQWHDLGAWLHDYGGGDGMQAQLLLVSSMPVVYMNFAATLRTLELIPRHQDLEDDIRDHWLSRRHRAERKRLIMNLLDFGKLNECRVTILSGDVHIGARGRIRSRNPAHVYGGRQEIAIEQIISSGIVYPPPTSLQYRAVLASGTEWDDEIESDVVSKVVPLTGNYRYLRARNFLSVRADTQTEGRFRLWFKYVAEGVDVTEQIVVEA